MIIFSALLRFNGPCAKFEDAANSISFFNYFSIDRNRKKFIDKVMARKQIFDLKKFFFYIIKWIF